MYYAKTWPYSVVIVVDYYPSEHLSNCIATPWKPFIVWHHSHFFTRKTEKSFQLNIIYV